MTNEEHAAAVATIIQDAEATFASIRDDLRRTTTMTEEQIEASEGHARLVLGFPKPKPTPQKPEEIADAKPVLDEKLDVDAEKP